MLAQVEGMWDLASPPFAIRCCMFYQLSVHTRGVFALRELAQGRLYHRGKIPYARLSTMCRLLGARQ